MSIGVTIYKGMNTNDDWLARGANQENMSAATVFRYLSALWFEGMHHTHRAE
jgi:hypothetical protein